MPHKIKCLAVMLIIVTLLTGFKGKNRFAPPNGLDVYYINESKGENKDTATTSVVSDNKSSSNKVSKTSSDKKTNSEREESKKEEKSVWDKDYVENIPKSLKDKGVYMLLSRELLPFEEKVILEFERQTGMDVTVEVVPQKDYLSKLAVMVGEGSAPDVAEIGFANLYSTAAYFTPLDNDTFRLEDKIWDTEYMQGVKYKGNYFGLSIKGAPRTEGNNYVTYYNKSILTAAGITATPYELYLSGRWNWTNQRNIAEKLKTCGKGLTPISLEGMDLYMLSAGVDFVLPAENGFASALSDSAVQSIIYESFEELRLLKSKNMLTQFNPYGFQNGEIGMVSAKAFHMYNSDSFCLGFKGKSSQLEAVPIAGPTQETAHTPLKGICLGVPKGAKNIEGAAYFIRYFLDPKNADTGNLFYNSQFKKVYSEITKGENVKKQCAFSEGILNAEQDGLYSEICNAAANANKGETLNEVLSYKEKIDNAVKK